MEGRNGKAVAMDFYRYYLTNLVIELVELTDEVYSNWKLTRKVNLDKYRRAVKDAFNLASLLADENLIREIEEIAGEPDPTKLFSVKNKLAALVYEKGLTDIFRIEEFETILSEL